MTLKPVQPVSPVKRRSISLRWLLILGFGGLVALSIGAVLTMSVMANFKNTFSLLNERTLQMIAGMERSIKGEMRQVEFALSGARKLAENGTYDVTKPQDQQVLLQTILQSVEVIESAVIILPDGSFSGFNRQSSGDVVAIVPPPHATIEIRDGGATPDNNKPVWMGSHLRRNSLSNEIVQNVYRGEEIVAQIAGSVGGKSINRLVASLADEQSTAFVLNDKGELIAHSARSSLFNEKPTYNVDDFPTLAMRGFSGAEKLRGFVDNGVEEDRFQLSRNGSEAGRYFYITTPMQVFSSAPYTVGAYFRESDINDELRRAGGSAMLGLGALLITLVAAILLSNRLSKPMRRIADSSQKFSRLELEGFEPLPESRVRELNVQATGINSMHTALSQFSKYVPQQLVQRILESGAEVTRPVERPVTVMFTDIANFTAGSEALDAAAITTMLNEHFNLISRCVANSHGTVDKYLGDGVMAFWGAPETDDDHAAHAIEAALRIKQQFQQECADRRGKGLPCLQLRIGIHSGRAIVGNIGGDDRTNYTVIGHTVNVANRIEQLGKDYIGERDVLVAISRECFSEAGEPEGFVAAGAHQVRGSSRPVSLFINDSALGGANVVDMRSTAS